MAFVLYAALLSRNMGAIAGGSDSSGYLNQARLLREGRIRTTTRAMPSAPAPTLSAYAYVPLGFAPADPGDPRQMVGIYPIGLPLLLAGVSLLTGWNAAAPVTMLAHALAGIVLTYALGRRTGLSVPWGLLGAVMLAASPLYPFASLQLLSDVPALVWTTAAVLAALRGRNVAGWAGVSGVFFAVAVLVRPTNALTLVPLLIVFIPARRNLFWFGLGGLPFAVGLLAYNDAAYGHALRFGYGPIWDSFGWPYVGVTLLHYVHWLPVVLTPLVVGAATLPWLKDGPPRNNLLLATWIGVFAAFYAFYPITHDDWWSLRFLLPAFPPLIVSTLLVARSFAARATGVPPESGEWRLSGLTAIAVLAWCIPWSLHLRSYKTGHDDRAYLEAIGWAREHLPGDAVIFAQQTTGALYHYTNFVFIHWPFVIASDVERITAAAKQENRPIYAMLFSFEEEFLKNREPAGGEWQRVAVVRTVSFWQWHPKREG